MRSPLNTAPLGEEPSAIGADPMSRKISGIFNRRNAKNEEIREKTGDTDWFIREGSGDETVVKITPEKKTNNLFTLEKGSCTSFPLTKQLIY